VVPALGTVPVQEMRVKHVAFLAEKRKARYGAKHMPYSKNALRLMKAALSSLLTDAVEDQSGPGRDGSQKTESREGERPRRARHYPTATRRLPDSGAFARRTWFAANRVRVMWELRVKTGLRPEEPYALHVGDVDLDAGSLRIER